MHADDAALIYNLLYFVDYYKQTITNNELEKLPLLSGEASQL